MKRIFALLFAVAIVLSASAMGGKCGDGLRWNLDKDGLLTISGSGAMKDYGNDGTPWINYLVKDVEISEGVTYIGNNAFRGSKIYEVKLPSTITAIGKYAYAGCKNLASVQLPYGLQTIGEGAFSNCGGIGKILIPASVRNIDKKAFENCKTLGSIMLPDRLEFIGDEAFKGCEALSSIGLPGRLEKLGKETFKGCRNLTSFTSLPDFITEYNCLRYNLPKPMVARYLNGSKGGSVAAANSGNSKSNVKSESKPAPVNQNQAARNVKVSEYGKSDVDMNVPLKTANNSQTFAFIFANENYTNMAAVPFAINDGKSFATYCNSTLGIPESNINVYYDATYGNMKSAVDYMKKLDDTFKGDLNFIVYYAGHGAPDEVTSASYLIPTDAHTVNSSVCYPLEDLYKELGQLKARSVKVFMDACFSGLDRSNEMVAQGGRLVATVPKKANVSGNVVVISATSNDQPAWFYQSQGHGLFTYCLLKAMQETKGEMSMGELCDYLQKNVPQISIVENRRIQTPTLQTSPLVGSRWRNWQLK